MRVTPLIIAVALGLTGCAKAADIAGSDAASTETPSTPPETTSSPSESAAPTTSTPTDTPPPPPELAPRPAVGDCYAATRAAFSKQRDGSFPVRCSRPHTAETYAVLSVGAYPLAKDIARAWRQCHDRFDDYVGASATVSTLGIALIMPSSAQAAAGQGWIRCDVIERANFNGQIGLERTGSVRNALQAKVPDKFRGCSKHWPRVLQKVHFTSCDANHQAELIPVSVRIGGPKAPFPGVKVTQQRSSDFCKSNVLDYVPEALRYYYYYPTRSSWVSGTRDTVCWALDTDGDGLPPI